MRSSHNVRRTLVVLDANSYWTERFFAEFGHWAKVLLLKPRDLRSHWGRTGHLVGPRRPTRVRENVWQKSVSLPPRWFYELWPWASTRLARTILDFTSDGPTLFAFNYPQYSDLVAHIHPTASVYYNTDDYSHHWSLSPGEVQAIEARAVATADMTICISERRCDELQAASPLKHHNFHYLPIGCSPELMVEGVDFPRPPLPASLQGLRRPIAIYVGALNWRFDFEFFVEVASQLPHITFALGGKPPRRRDGNRKWWADFQTARRLPNVHLVGWVQHQKLPGFLTVADVLFMCYTRHEVNASACPMKLWDYLGTSLPIVANDVVPEVNRISELVHICGTPNAFATTLDREARGYDGDHRRLQLEFARSRTWARLAEQGIRMFDDLLARSMMDDRR